ncbi:hypothetical protein EDB19DRAFT_2027033 [Suillus lakei]|nr:hypothetical protein EDB19DRAFT_2027033 [Suillus lakei]
MYHSPFILQLLGTVHLNTINGYVEVPKLDTYALATHGMSGVIALSAAAIEHALNMFTDNDLKVKQVLASGSQGKLAIKLTKVLNKTTGKMTNVPFLFSGAHWTKVTTTSFIKSISSKPAGSLDDESKDDEHAMLFRKATSGFPDALARPASDQARDRVKRRAPLTSLSIVPAFSRQLEVVEIASMLALLSTSSWRGRSFRRAGGMGMRHRTNLTCLHTEDYDNLALLKLPEVSNDVPSPGGRAPPPPLVILGPQLASAYCRGFNSIGAGFHRSRQLAAVETCCCETRGSA